MPPAPREWLADDALQNCLASTGIGDSGSYYRHIIEIYLVLYSPGNIGWQTERGTIVRTGITSLLSASAMLTAVVLCGTAGAEPKGDDEFLDLLDQQGIPAVDGTSGLIARAHGICHELDGGTPYDAIVNEQMNNTFEDNPALHLVPGRVNRTATKFIFAAVNAYCPSHQNVLP